MEKRILERRQILGYSLALGAAATVAGCATTAARSAEERGGEEDVGPAEDLMREHGVLNRILLVYEECRHRLDERTSEIPAGLLLDTAALVHRFVHEYHEALEEREVFPRLEQAGHLADLTSVLRRHHAAGRVVTAHILDLSSRERGLTDPERNQLSSRLADFVRMYRPHEAREDTVVFPTFHSMFSPKEWDALGDLFEGKEKETLGAEGFKHAVERVADFERALGIHDLALFTPPA
jgi:hemerythrin-like domain-containing protein